MQKKMQESKRYVPTFAKGRYECLIESANKEKKLEVIASLLGSRLDFAQGTISEEDKNGILNFANHLSRNKKFHDLNLLYYSILALVEGRKDPNGHLNFIYFNKLLNFKTFVERSDRVFPVAAILACEVSDRKKLAVMFRHLESILDYEQYWKKFKKIEKAAETINVEKINQAINQVMIEDSFFQSS